MGKIVDVTQLQAIHAKRWNNASISQRQIFIKNILPQIAESEDCLEDSMIDKKCTIYGDSTDRITPIESRNYNDLPTIVKDEFLSFGNGDI